MLRCRNPDCRKVLTITNLPSLPHSRHESVGVPGGLASSGFSDGVAGGQVGGPVLTADWLTELGARFLGPSGRPDGGRLLAHLSDVCYQWCGEDLPLCDSCLPLALSTKEKASRRICAERDVYAAFHARLEAEEEEYEPSVTPQAPHGSLDEELEALRQEEEELRQELEALAAEEEVLLTKQRRALATISAFDAREWVDWNTNSRRAAVTHKLTEGFTTREHRCKVILRKLQHITVHNDAFFVWYDGPFGTINGFRLGTLPTQTVYWTEMNAALGQMALLMATVSNQTGFLFSKYRVVPQGSFSKITKIGDERTAYELYFDNKMFATRRLNQALKCFTECVHELAEYAEANDRSLRLPYPVSKEGTVADLPITLGRDAQWARAMKFLLTDLKWLLAWATQQS